MKRIFNFHQSTIQKENEDDIRDRSSFQQKHSDVVSRKRDEREEDEAKYYDENEQSNSNNNNNNNKKAKVTVASSVPESDADPGLLVVNPLLASFDTLDDDCLGDVLEFVGKKCYGVFGLVNKRCHEMFRSKGLAKETYLFGYASLRFIQHRRRDCFYDVNVAKGVLQYNRRDIFNWILSDQSNDGRLGYNNLKWLCAKAIEESRLDILREVFQRADEWQLEILRKCCYNPDLCDRAGQFGKLECLKFLRENECEWVKWTWIRAKENRHEHILEYMRNNGYPAEWQR